jgi:PTS system nitrogen regulatory IIA component
MPPLDSRAIILDLKAATKEGALRELAALAATRCGRCTEETLYAVLVEREAIGSTGVGNGVAIPHGKVTGLDDILLCFGRSREGIDFDAIDNQPVHFFFLILSPLNVAEEYLQNLARVSRFLKQPEKRRLLRLATTRQEIIEIFGQAE